MAPKPPIPEILGPDWREKAPRLFGFTRRFLEMVMQGRYKLSRRHHVMLIAYGRNRKRTIRQECRREVARVEKRYEKMEAELSRALDNPTE